MPRELRVSRNSDLIQQVNDRIHELEGKWRSDEPVGFVCECSAVGCTTTVYMTIEEYERVRAAGLMLTAPTHVDLENERALVATENYAVIERVPEGDS
jgi:hypothetical protein